jgi:hypothetical protein
VTYVFKVANKVTGKSMRIVAENVRIPVGLREEARKHVLGAQKAKEVEERRKLHKEKAPKGD